MITSTASRLAISLTIAVLGSGCAARVVVPAQPPPPDARQSIEGWERRHPDASRELGEWVHRHPRAAEPFFQWDSRHSGAAQGFVTWTIRNPDADIDVFAVEHRQWEEFNWVMTNHRPAANEFMAWCRRHPRAAEDLMRHPGGLYWAGTHLYQSSWEMQRSGN